MKFNDWLLEELKSRDWSQSDLSRQSGISRQAISYYINGRVPDADALRKIARALKLPPNLIFEKAGILPPEPGLSPIKRTVIHLLEDADDEDARLVLSVLEAIAARKKSPHPSSKPNEKPLTP